MLMDSVTVHEIMSVDDKEQKVQKFTEWLQSQPPEKYKNFVEILDRTDQSQVAAQLLKSCKSSF